MSLAQPQREDAPSLHIDAGENIGLQIEFRIVGHQAGVAVDDDDARVLRPSENDAHGAAVLARICERG